MCTKPVDSTKGPALPPGALASNYELALPETNLMGNMTYVEDNTMVRLISATNLNLGIMSLLEARQMADRLKERLELYRGDHTPPVYRLVSTKSVQFKRENCWRYRKST